MERSVMIDEREVRFRTSAAIPRMYRMKFRRDIIQDMKIIQLALDRQEKAQKAAKGKGQPVDVSIPAEALTLFENVAYLMARHAEPGIPDTVEKWMEGFETFSIYQVFPVVSELWSANLRTMSTPAKK